MILAIDFDGVIHDYKNPIEGRRMGAPVVGTRDALLKYKHRGDRIIIHSVWADMGNRKVIADFMNYYRLPYDEITNVKPNADYYIDDKAIKFTSWNNLGTYIHYNTKILTGRCMSKIKRKYATI